MKKGTPICTLLGVTQMEMSTLLGISRSLWGMFELGQRDLPLKAKLKLNELLSHVQDRENRKPAAPMPQKSTLYAFEGLLCENQYKMYMLARKIEALEKKQDLQQRLQQLDTFLNVHNKSESHGSLLIAGKAARASGVLEELKLLRFRNEVLEFEKNLLESTISQLKSALPDLNTEK